jgi:hypothetical protein
VSAHEALAQERPDAMSVGPATSNVGTRIGGRGQARRNLTGQSRPRRWKSNFKWLSGFDVRRIQEMALPQRQVGYRLRVDSGRSSDESIELQGRLTDQPARSPPREGSHQHQVGRSNTLCFAQRESCTESGQTAPNQ